MRLTSQRLAWVDMLRGIALVGMVAYHAAWDLHAFAITQTDPGQDGGWRLLGRGVAGLFLVLSGFGLSLAARHGVSVRSTVLRLGRLAAAAAVVSFVTWVSVPEAPIWFGILHCIVVTNVLALAMLPLRSSVLLGAAACAFSAPFALHGAVGSGWAWIGLAASEPATLDFRPILPWLAPVLIGVVLGRTALATMPDPAWLPAAFTRTFAGAGRRSLLIYLCHQPLMIAVLITLVGAIPQRGPSLEGLRNPEQAAAFLQQCHKTCGANGAGDALCRSTCHCVLTTAANGSAADRSSSIFNATAPDLNAAVATCRRALSKEEP